MAWTPSSNILLGGSMYIKTIKHFQETTRNVFSFPWLLPVPSVENIHSASLRLLRSAAEPVAGGSVSSSALTRARRASVGFSMVFHSFLMVFFQGCLVFLCFFLFQGFLVFLNVRFYAFPRFACVSWFRELRLLILGLYLQGLVQVFGVEDVDKWLWLLTTGRWEHFSFCTLFIFEP